MGMACEQEQRNEQESRKQYKKQERTKNRIFLVYKLNDFSIGHVERTDT